MLDSNGQLVAILRNIEIYKHNKQERIARTWGTTAPGLPYVKEAIVHAGNWLIGGDLEFLEQITYNDGGSGVMSQGNADAAAYRELL